MRLMRHLMVALLAGGVALDSRATLLLNDPLAGYAQSTLVGQSYQGSGFAAGSWSLGAGDASVTAGSLAYTNNGFVYPVSGDKAATPAAGFNTVLASVDVSGTGPFNAAGLIDGGLVGGANVSGTLYYSFLARNASTDLAGSDDFAGLQLFNGGAEIFGVGNNWGAWAYSTFTAGGEGDLLRPSDNAFYSMDAATHLFVVKVQYNASADDSATVWMDPHLSLTDLTQPNTVYQRTVTGNLNFDRIALRSGSNNNNNNWEFDEIRMATTWTEVVPEPGTAFLALAGGLALLLRRRLA